MANRFDCPFCNMNMLPTRALKCPYCDALVGVLTDPNKTIVATTKFSPMPSICICCGEPTNRLEVVVGAHSTLTGREYDSEHFVSEYGVWFFVTALQWTFAIILSVITFGLWIPFHEGPENSRVLTRRRVSHCDTCASKSKLRPAAVDVEYGQVMFVAHPEFKRELDKLTEQGHVAPESRFRFYEEPGFRRLAIAAIVVILIALSCCLCAGFFSFFGD